MPRSLLPLGLFAGITVMASCTLAPLPAPPGAGGAGGTGGAAGEGGMGGAGGSSSSASTGGAGGGGAPFMAGAATFAENEIAAFDIHLSLSDVDSLNDDPKKYVKADIDVTLGGKTTTVPDVGVRIKGNAGSLRTLSQKAAFLLKFDEFEKGQTFDGLEKLALNNMVQDASMIHENLAYGLMRAAGVPAPRAGYATVRINGEPYGLYATIEATNDPQFLKAHFGSDEGNLYEGAYGSDLQTDLLPSFDQDSGTYVDMADLKELVAALDAMTDPEAFVDEVSKVIDLDEYLHFAATEIFLGHWDGYAWTKNNFFIYRRPSDGRYAWIPWGIDQTFDQNLDPFGGDGRIQQMCRTSTPCRTKLALAFEDVIARVAELDMIAQANALRAHIEPDMKADPRKEINESQNASAIDATIAFLTKRPFEVSDALVCADPTMPVDLDNDGSPGCGTDCNDHDATIYPGAPEACNFIDDDCNGQLDEPGCPLCKYVPTPGGGSFAFCIEYRDWYGAEGDCAAQGGHLVSIHDSATQTLVHTEAFSLVDGDWWIGANDDAVEGEFAWTDGTPFDFDAWHSGEPNNAGGENCGTLASWAGGNWNDVPCWDGRPYVCKLP